MAGRNFFGYILHILMGWTRICIYIMTAIERVTKYAYYIICLIDLQYTIMLHKIYAF